MRLLALLLSALALTGSHWRTFRADGIRVRYPPSWFATAARLTPVVEPAQILAVASYPLPRGSGGANGCQPKEALHRLPLAGALIFGWEYGQGMSKRDFPQRPKHFRLTGSAPYECLGPSYMLRFRQAGRFFQIHVVLGTQVSRATRATVLRILNSFRAKPI